MGWGLAMSIWSFARQTVPDFLGAVSQSPSTDLVGRALLIDQVVKRVSRRDRRGETPGVALLEAGPRMLSIAVLVDVNRVDGIGAGERMRLSRLPIFRGIQAALPNTDWLIQLEAFGVYEPEFQLASGNTISASTHGSAGCALSWIGGHGFATAGHVAPTIGQTVYEAGAAVGTVLWANDPNNTGANPEADFAVVELDPGASFSTTNAPYITGAAHDPLSFVSGAGHPPPATPATIMGYCVSWALPSYNATLGEAYLTSQQISASGDSGAPVHLASGELIGHVVGASPGILTIVQDLDFQLQEAGAHVAGLKA